jgi:RNA polymerase sigma-70 factor, ECF subfamily
MQVSGENLYGWMTIASRNRAIDVLRTRQLDSLDSYELISRSDTRQQTENRLTCEKVLDLLEADPRMLVEMAFLKEMSHAEIAEATGWPLGTIKTLIRRALMNVKSTIAQPAL